MSKPDVTYQVDVEEKIVYRHAFSGGLRITHAFNFSADRVETYVLAERGVAVTAVNFTDVVNKDEIARMEQKLKTAQADR